MRIFQPTGARRLSLRRLTSSQHWPIITLSAIWLLAIPLVNPVGDFPLNDDWAWGKAVKALVADGQIRIPAWAGMSLIAQVVWGAMFSVFGFTFTALRFSTLVLGLGCILATYGLGLVAGLTRTRAFLAGLVVLVQPLIMHSSYSFMTDIPFATFCVLAAFAFGYYLKHGSRWAAALSVAAPVIAVLIRQLGLILPMMYLAGAIVAREKRRSTYVLITSAGATTFAALKSWESWANAHGQLGGMYGRLTGQVLNALTHPSQLGPLISALPQAAVYIGCMLLPLLILTVPRSAPRNVIIGAALGVVVSALLLMGGFGTLTLLPFDRIYNLMDLGMGPITLTDVYDVPQEHLPRAPRAFWAVLTLLGVAGAGLMAFVIAQSVALLLQAQADKAQRAVVGMALAFCVGYMIIAGLVRMYDRYYIPLLPMFAIVFLVHAANLAHRAALAMMAGLFFYAVAGTHDYLALNRARWEGLRDLTEARGVSVERIDGGFEFNGWYRFPQRSRPGKKWWWVNDDHYMATVGPMPNYQLFSRWPFHRYMPWGESAAYILVRSQP